MGLGLGSSLMCSIITRGVGLGARHTHTCHHVKIIATTTSQPNPKTLLARLVLTHSRTAFYPYMYGLHAVVAALIGYDDVGLLP
jgi:hypothetical protein